MMFRRPIASAVSAAVLLAALATPAASQPSDARPPTPPASDLGPSAQQSSQKPQAPRGPAATLPERLEVLLKAMRIARDWHVGNPGRPELIAGAIEGLLARVDAEAEVYTRSELRRITRAARSAPADVGLEVRREPYNSRHERRGYTVVASVDGSPAAAAGLKAGDLITHVDGAPAGRLAHLVMTELTLRGAPGSELRLRVRRSGEDAPVDVTLVRTSRRPEPVAVDSPAPGVVRVRFAGLDGSAADALAAAVEREAPPGGGLRGLVLDLRSTAGGTLDGARAVADAVLESGPILATVTRDPAQARRFAARPGDIVRGRPIAVLADAGTAGPAEVLAAALVESRRARLVGTQTAGRTAIRSLRPLGNAGAKGFVRMTTERAAAPSGTPLDGKGLTPETVVEQSPASPLCRAPDMPDPAAPSAICRRRPLDDDAQLRRAIALIDESLLAGQPTGAERRP